MAQRVVLPMLTTSLRVLVVAQASLVGHRVENRVETRLTLDWLNHWLHTLLDLLIVEASAVAHAHLVVLSLLLLAQVHVLELLGCSSDIDKLLLKTHLLLGKVLVGAHKLVIQMGIHLRIVDVFSNLNGRWSKDLLWRIELVHLSHTVLVLLVLVCVGESRTRGGLGDALLLVLTVHGGIATLVEPTSLVLELSWRS